MRPVTIHLVPWAHVGAGRVNRAVARGRDVIIYDAPLTRIAHRCAVQNLSDAATWATQKSWLQDYVLGASGQGPIFLHVPATGIKDPSAFADLLAPCDPVYIVQDRHAVSTIASATPQAAEYIKKGRAIIAALTKSKQVTTYYFEDLLHDPDGVIRDIFDHARISYVPHTQNRDEEAQFKVAVDA